MKCVVCNKKLTQEAQFCIHCGTPLDDKKILGNNDNYIQSTKPEIREVKINLIQPDGRYPTVTYRDKVRVTSGRHSLSSGTWSPSHFSMEYLQQILLDEINKWLSEGWELVETDLNNVWERDYQVTESAGTLLGDILGLSSKMVFIKKWEYKGAKFHVKRNKTTS